MHRTTGWLALAACVLAATAIPAKAQGGRITYLYDAFGPPSTLEKDWGFAALVEYAGKRILFDTGNDAGIFQRNAKKLNVDLARLDAVVISHRHGDHTSGLTYLLEVNAQVRIYAPPEGAFFRGPTPAAFFAAYKGGLAPELRYFDGAPPQSHRTGSPWDKGNFQIIRETTEIFPGFFLFVTQSQKPGTLEMNELSLAFRTPNGLVVVVGCAHPGVEKITESAARIDPRIHGVTGGFHLVLTPEAEIRRVADALHDTLKVGRIAPAHCTSELGFAVLIERFGERFERAGLGTVLRLD